MIEPTEKELRAQERAKEMKIFRVTLTGRDWRLLDLSLKQEQKSTETRAQTIPNQEYGPLRQEIENCLNGHDDHGTVKVTVEGDEFSLLERHARKIGILLDFEVIP